MGFVYKCGLNIEMSADPILNVPPPAGQASPACLSPRGKLYGWPELCLHLEQRSQVTYRHLNHHPQDHHQQHHHDQFPLMVSPTGRLHHKASETNGDPHNALRGFFFAHMGWLCVR